MSLGNGATLGYIGMSCYITLENMMCWHNHAWPLSKWHVKSWQFRKRHIWFSVHIFCIYCNLHMQSVKDWKKHKGNSAFMKSNHALFSVHPNSHLSLPLYCTCRVFSTVPDWSFMQNKPQTNTNNYLWILEENRITFYYLHSCYSWSLYFILPWLLVHVNIWDSSRCPAFQQRWCHWCQIVWQTWLLHKSKELKHQTNYVYD